MANLTYRVMLRDSAGGSGVSGLNGQFSTYWKDPIEAFVASPPVGALNGTRYIVANTAATGAFLGRENQIATLVGGTWAFQAPQHGYVVLDKQTQSIFFYDGTQWRSPHVLIPFDGDRPITRNIPAVYQQNMEAVDLVTFTDRVFFIDEPPILDISATVDVADPSFPNTLREIGNTATAVTLVWSVRKKQLGITAIFVDGTAKAVSELINEDTDAVDAVQSGTQPGTIGLNGAGKQTFVLQATDTANANHYDTTSAIGWWHRCYYGALTESPAQLKTRLQTESPYAIAGLLSAPATSRVRNHNYNCSGGKFIHYLYPLSGGTGILSGKGFGLIPTQMPGYVKNGVGDFSAFTTETITITDRFGVQRQYVLLSTGYQTGESVNINVHS